MEAKHLKESFDLTSVKLLYWYFIDKRNFVPKVEEKFPQIEWENVWENINSCYISLEDKSRLYYFVNDLIPNKEKLFNFGIGRLQNPNCETCLRVDNNTHRIMECSTGAQQVWEWTKEVLRNHIYLLIWLYINYLDEASPTIFRQFPRFMAASLHPRL